VQRKASDHHLADRANAGGSDHEGHEKHYFVPFVYFVVASLCFAPTV